MTSFRCRFLNISDTGDLLYLMVTLFMIIHMLSIVLMASGNFLLMWLVILLPEIVGFILVAVFFVVGMARVIREDWRCRNGNRAS